MLGDGLRGVIAAITTPVNAKGVPDHARLIARAADLLTHGCDGLNLLGTTGEATSFTAAQRRAAMEAVAKSGVPVDQLMVGTGAAAIGDAATLTLCAADLGFAAALLLPPFYYKPVTPEGIARYVGTIIEATAHRPIPIYLYNFPALSGVQYSTEVVALLLERFGDRIAGLKDSSGDLSYAQSVAQLSPALRVFPSNEATLLRARAGDFAGCISATANLNSRYCAAAYHEGDSTALAAAVAIRALFNNLPLVPGIKTVLARHENDPSHANLVPPLTPLTREEERVLWERYAQLPV